MAERVKLAAKTSETKRENSVSQKQKPDFSQSTGTPVDQILFLQRTIGNQAVLKLMQKSVDRSQKSGVGIQAKLTIGQPNDVYEQEADRVAERVMGMPDEQHIADSPLRSIAYSHKPYAISHTLSEDESVQRKPT